MVADFIDGRHVRMVQPGGRLGLAAKPREVGCGGQLAAKDHLERHDPSEADLPRAEHDAHAAATDLLENLVIADALTGLEGRRPARGARGALDRIEHLRHAGKILGHHGRRPKHADFVDQVGMPPSQSLEVGILTVPRLGSHFVEQVEHNRVAILRVRLARLVFGHACGVALHGNVDITILDPFVHLLGG